MIQPSGGFKEGKPGCKEQKAVHVTSTAWILELPIPPSVASQDIFNQGRWMQNLEIPKRAMRKELHFQCDA